MCNEIDKFSALLGRLHLASDLLLCGTAASLRHLDLSLMTQEPDQFLASL